MNYFKRKDNFYLVFKILFFAFIVFSVYQLVISFFQDWDKEVSFSPDKEFSLNLKEEISSSDANSLIKENLGILKNRKFDFKEKEDIQDYDQSPVERKANEDLILDELSRNGVARVIVFFNPDDVSSKEFKNFLDYSSENINIKNSGKVIPFIAGSVTSENYDSYKRRITSVGGNLYYDGPVKSHLQESGSIINVPQVHQTIGLTGQGVGVCVVDGGIDYTHNNLGGCFGTGCKIAGGYDFCATSSPTGVCLTEDSDPMDEGSHGTHVAGIIGSTNSQYLGVAPDADILAVKVFSSGNALSSFSTIALGIDWCLQNSAQYNIKVITMSLGDSPAQYNSDSCPTILSVPLSQANQAGITVVASSGNDGSLSGISYPACSPKVLDVGATYDSNFGMQQWIPCSDETSFVDKVVCFTNRDRGTLLAPGSFITSTVSQTYACGSTTLSGYCVAAGTSFAAPHVAGAAALIAQQNPALTPEQINVFLKNYGSSVYDVSTDLYYPRIDIESSILSLGLTTSYISGISRPGGDISFDLVSADNSGKLYLYLLSFGRSPGIPLGDGRIISLNPDGLFATSLSSPSSLNFPNIGLLDSSGFASFDWNIPTSLPEDTTIYGSLLVIDTSLPYPQSVISFSVPSEIDLLSLNSVSVMSTQLPLSLAETSCVSIGNLVTCLGGNNWGTPIDDIFSYDVLQNQNVQRIATLPSPRSDMSCVESNGKVYCFGGNAWNSFMDQILEYDPILDTLSVKTSTLPSPRTGVSCAKISNNNILCSGGRDSSNYFDDIFLYEPILDTLTVLPQKLPFAISDHSCIYQPLLGINYCVGGSILGVETGDIFSYGLSSNLDSNSVTLLGGKLPTPRKDSSCVENDGNIYCFGGSFSLNELDQIVIFDIGEGITSIDDSSLPDIRRATSCVENDGNIYCFGGFGSSGPGQFSLYPTIVKYEI